MRASSIRPGNLRSEDGSLPFVLLASIVIGGLVTVLIASTINGQTLARRDRDHAEAIFGADTGVQQAVAVVNGLYDPIAGAGTTDLWGTQAAIGTELAAQYGSSSDVFYRYDTKKTGPRQWLVRSTGCRLPETSVTTFDQCIAGDGVTRVAEAIVEQRNLFALAAFADEKIKLQGSQQITSYNSTGTNNEGQVGTNGTIERKGSSGADGYELWGPAASCTGCTSGTTQTFSDERDLPETFIDGYLDACTRVNYTSGTGFTDDHDNDGSTAVVTNIDELHSRYLPYCFNNVTISDKDFRLVLSDIDGDGEVDPVRIFMTGKLIIGNDIVVNCPALYGTVRGGGKYDCGTPDATKLQIYSSGSSVVVGNKVWAAGAVYAPKAACEGNPSNAQTEWYGSMICNDMTNQGGWNFHYDEALSNLGTGIFEVTEWLEEVGSTSTYYNP